MIKKLTSFMVTSLLLTGCSLTFKVENNMSNNVIYNVEGTNLCFQNTVNQGISIRSQVYCDMFDKSDINDYHFQIEKNIFKEDFVVIDGIINVDKSAEVNRSYGLIYVEDEDKCYIWADGKNKTERGCFND